MPTNRKAPICEGSLVTPKDKYNTFLCGDLFTVVELKGRYCMCVRGDHTAANAIPNNLLRHKINKSRLVVVGLINGEDE